MYEDKQKIYEEIETNKMGKDFKYKVNEVKDEQCSICTKRNKNNCRLEFECSRCKNFTRRRI